MANNQITLGSMFREMNSWVPCQSHFEAADKSGITTKNSVALKNAVEEWQSGIYDEDPNSLVNELIYILESK